MRKYYAAHREERRAIDRRMKKRLRKFVDHYKKKNGCQKCGYKEHPEILQFHHIVPLKIPWNVRVRGICMTNQHWSVKRLKEEIKKCLLLCPNCHALEHYKKGKGFR